MRTVIFNILFITLVLIANITSLHAEDLGAEGDAPSMGTSRWMEDFPFSWQWELLYGVGRVRKKMNG